MTVVTLLSATPCAHTCTWCDICTACRTKALQSALAAMDPPPQGVKIVEGFVDNYQQLLLTSTFCLAPYGHGWGLRLIQAVQHGCVPVVVQDSVYQPYEVRQHGSSRNTATHADSSGRDPLVFQTCSCFLPPCLSSLVSSWLIV